MISEPLQRAVDSALSQGATLATPVQSVGEAKELWAYLRATAASTDPLIGTSAHLSLRMSAKYVGNLGTPQDGAKFTKVAALLENATTPAERVNCAHRLKDIADRVIKQSGRGVYDELVDALRLSLSRAVGRSLSWVGFDLRRPRALSTERAPTVGPAFYLIYEGTQWETPPGPAVVAVLPAKIAASPYFKWAGRKTKLVPKISAYLHLEYADLYVEPFMGTGAVYLETAFPRAALLSDANPRVAALHQAVREDAEAVIRELDRCPWDAAWRDHYDQRRASFNHRPVEATPAFAADMLWLLCTQYNGLWRENQRGHLNTTQGEYEIPTRPRPDRLRAASQALREAEIACADFRVVLEAVERTPLDVAVAVYADPPYVPLSKTASFRGYSSGGFSEADQRDLAQALARIAKRPHAQVVASNADAPFVRELYGGLGFQIVPVRVTRTMSAKSETRGEIGELLLIAGSASL